MVEHLNRQAVIYDELDQAHETYIDAKSAYIDAQVRFESARERFSGLQRLAAEMLPTSALGQWRSKHSEVQFMGLPIGEAILKVLDIKAVNSAWGVVFVPDEHKRFWPFMLVGEIMAELETGGFEFQSATPLREINAALLKLEGVVKDGQKYKSAEADDRLVWMKQYKAEQDAAAAAKADEEASKRLDEADDNVPF